MGEVSEKVLEIFKSISDIPRGSKNEKQISDWLCKFASERGLEYKQDKLLNVLIKVPATEGYELKPIIVLQGHMDMVCTKRGGVIHDFTKDPIKLVRDGEWLRADGTTLGADNGIALAMALAIADDKNIAHPALELLFTVDEEQGMSGASGLEPDFIKGRKLVNIDWEEDSGFGIGCADGRLLNVTFPLERTSFNNQHIYTISLSGLKGGHSGVDINKHRGNAIKLMARFLRELSKKCEFDLFSINADFAKNVIPASAEAVISCSHGDELNNLISDMSVMLKAEYPDAMPHITLTVGESEFAPMSQKSRDALLSFLTLAPCGVYDLTSFRADRVETSNNIAPIITKEHNVELTLFARSLIASRGEELADKIRLLVKAFGAELDEFYSNPPWEPNYNSQLLEDFKKLYKFELGTEPEIEVVHAGLECGIIGAKYAGMDMIAIGPTMEGVHSPDEKLHVPSIERIYRILTAYLKL